MSQPDLELHTSVACLKQQVAQHAEFHVEHRDAIHSLVASMSSREGWFKGIGTIVTVVTVASAAANLYAATSRVAQHATAPVATQKASP